MTKAGTKTWVAYWRLAIALPVIMALGGCHNCSFFTREQCGAIAVGMVIAAPVLVPAMIIQDIRDARDNSAP